MRWRRNSNTRSRAPSWVKMFLVFHQPNIAKDSVTLCIKLWKMMMRMSPIWANNKNDFCYFFLICLNSLSWAFYYSLSYIFCIIIHGAIRKQRFYNYLPTKNKAYLIIRPRRGRLFLSSSNNLKRHIARRYKLRSQCVWPRKFSLKNIQKIQQA